MDPPNNVPPSSDNYEPTDGETINTTPSTTSIQTVNITEESSAATQYNTRNPAVKRIMREAQEMARNSDDGIFARPLDDNIFEWHYTIRGTEGTEFELGLYHGRIILPAEYPMKPPSIIMLTPNGRFEVGAKICLSISSYHPETWRPSWSIRTALLALQSFMNTPSPGAIGSLDYSPEVRRGLARRSITWCCPTCGPNFENPIFRQTGNTNLAVNRNSNTRADSAALRVFHGPPSPPRQLTDESLPSDHQLPPFHDNRAGDVPRFKTDDSPQALANLDGEEVEEVPDIFDLDFTEEEIQEIEAAAGFYWPNQPVHGIAILGVIFAILTILMRRFLTAIFDL